MVTKPKDIDNITQFADFHRPMYNLSDTILKGKFQTKTRMACNPPVTKYLMQLICFIVAPYSILLIPPHS